MNGNKSPFLFIAGIALFGGLTLGYVLGNWPAAAQTVEARPKIFGLGTELIDKPKNPSGVSFDLTSVFGITSDFFHCVVETNDQPFTMPTHSLGTVEIGKNQFFMSVDSVSIESVSKPAA